MHTRNYCTECDTPKPCDFLQWVEEEDYFNGGTVTLTEMFEEDEDK